MSDELTEQTTKQLLRDRHSAAEEARTLAKARATHAGWYDAGLDVSGRLAGRRQTVRAIDAELARRAATTPPTGSGPPGPPA